MESCSEWFWANLGEEEGWAQYAQQDVHQNYEAIVKRTILIPSPKLMLASTPNKKMILN
jgi:hypothetical protein